MVTEPVLLPSIKNAVTLTAVDEATVPAVAVKVARFCPAVTTTDAGTVSAGLLLVSETVAPPVGANVFNVIVPTTVPPAFTDGLAKVTEFNRAVLTVIAAVSVSNPAAVAVTVARVSAATFSEVTSTLAEVAPCGTTIEAGAGKAALLLESVTVVPPTGAAEVRVTFKLALAPPLTVAGRVKLMASPNLKAYAAPLKLVSPVAPTRA